MQLRGSTIPKICSIQPAANISNNDFIGCSSLEIFMLSAEGFLGSCVNEGIRIDSLEDKRWQAMKQAVSKEPGDLLQSNILSACRLPRFT